MELVLVKQVLVELMFLRRSIVVPFLQDLMRCWQTISRWRVILADWGFFAGYFIEVVAEEGTHICVRRCCLDLWHLAVLGGLLVLEDAALGSSSWCG